MQGIMGEQLVRGVPSSVFFRVPPFSAMSGWPAGLTTPVHDRRTGPGPTPTSPGVENDPEVFKVVRIWHLPGKDFICIGPWTRDSFAIDDPGQCLWVGPRKQVHFSIAISAEISK